MNKKKEERDSAIAEMEDLSKEILAKMELDTEVKVIEEQYRAQHEVINRLMNMVKSFDDRARNIERGLKMLTENHKDPPTKLVELKSVSFEELGERVYVWKCSNCRYTELWEAGEFDDGYDEKPCPKCQNQTLYKGGTLRNYVLEALKVNGKTE